MTRRNRKKAQRRLFRCPECGFETYAPKRSRATSVGHIKDMYCFRCGDIRKFVQSEELPLELDAPGDAYFVIKGGGGDAM